MQTLQTRGRETALAIANREEFKTKGALSARSGRFGPWDSGCLRGNDLDRYREDMHVMDYVVFSYATPIAWHTPEGWYKVGQKFSVTTSKHQGNLYLV